MHVPVCTSDGASERRGYMVVVVVIRVDLVQNVHSSLKLGVSVDIDPTLYDDTSSIHA